MAPDDDDDDTREVAIKEAGQFLDHAQDLLADSPEAIVIDWQKHVEQEFQNEVPAGYHEIGTTRRLELGVDGGRTLVIEVRE